MGPAQSSNRRQGMQNIAHRAQPHNQDAGLNQIAVTMGRFSHNPSHLGRFGPKEQIGLGTQAEVSVSGRAGRRIAMIAYEPLSLHGVPHVRDIAYMAQPSTG